MKVRCMICKELIRPKNKAKVLTWSQRIDHVKQVHPGKMADFLNSIFEQEYEDYTENQMNKHKGLV